MVDKEGFPTTAPCKIEGLFDSIVLDVAPEGINNVEDTCEAECVVEE
jgi:hypothetical protein